MPNLRVPPHNEEAERSLIGAILIDRDAIVNIAEITKADHFYFDKHAAIFKAMVKLYDERSAIDVVTLTDELKKQKSLKQIGGASYLAELSTAVPTAAHVVEYANIVKHLYTRRSLITLAAEVNELAFDDSKEVTDVLDKAEADVFSLSYHQAKTGFQPLREALASSFERLDELQRTSGALRGVPTGFADLDRMLAGMQNSNLLICAARPGTGKTAFALNIAQYTSVVAKKKVAFFSLEMSKEELVDRLLVAQADIDAWKLKTGRLDDQDFLKISDAMGVLAEAPIYIDDTPGMSIFEMRTKARRLMSEVGIDMIVVDYLQLAQGRTKDNRVQEVGEISQGLKNLARELKVPVLSLAQLSRAVESRGAKIPQLSDLRESGCLTGETKVYLPDTGKYTTMAELAEQFKMLEKTKEKVINHPRILALNHQTWKLEPTPIQRAFATGVKPVFELKTRLGRVVRATANHQFLTINGWKRLDELKVEESLAVPIVIDSRITSDVYWDKILSITPLGEQEVFDLTIPGHANFVANNIIVHNSIEQDADVVMFLYRKDDDLREAVSLKVAKHRNGALGDIELFFKGDRIRFYGMEKKAS